MKQKITNLVQGIFAQAVALDQSGGLKNTIYAIKNEIFILNYDHTVLLRFKLRDSEIPFNHPISFKADSYDSNVFEEKDGVITFYSDNKEYSRKKACGTTDLSPLDVKKLYKKYITEKGERDTIILSKEVLELLDTNLSHIEFASKVNEGLKITQRNIYSGELIEVEKKKSDEGMYDKKIEHEFGPIAIKTNDFNALFNFQEVLKFSFPPKDKEDYLFVRGVDDTKRNFTGIIACCLYDEIINLKQVNHGRKVTKIRRRK